MVPHLTSYIIGHSHAAVFQSRVFSTAMLGAGLAYQKGRAAMQASKVVVGTGAAGSASANTGAQAARYAHRRKQ
jgi:hypothetical protein